MTEKRCFGKLPARHNLGTLALSNYTKMSALAFPPVKAWERPIELGMLGNDEVGDCTVAGFYHMLMTQRSVAQAGNPLIVTTPQALADYSAITGYDPTTGSNDNGALCADVLTYFQNKDMILGKASVDFHNTDMVKAAIYTFGCLYTGFTVPQSTVNELQHGIDPTFNFIPNDTRTNEGHCVNFVGYGRSGAAFDSWGKVYHMGWDYLLQWFDEAYVVVTPDWIKASGKSPSGLDLTGLVADMTAQG